MLDAGTSTADLVILKDASTQTEDCNTQTEKGATCGYLSQADHDLEDADSTSTQTEDSNTQTEEEATQCGYPWTPQADPQDADQDSDATVNYWESSSSGSYTDVYELDDEYDGPTYPSQPCIGGKHGASYTPPGWRHQYIKRRKLQFQRKDCDDSN